MKILFITSSRLGDAVISTVVLEILLNNIPNACVTVAGGSISLPLFNDHPQVKSQILFDKKKFSRHWWNLWLSVYKSKWDYVVDLRGSALSYFLNTSKRFIFRPHNSEYPMSHQLTNWTHTQLQLAYSPTTIPFIHIGATRQSRVIQLLNSKTKLIAIAPKANWLPKEWPLDNFITLIKKLTHSEGLFPNYNVIVCAAPSEHQALTDLKVQLKHQLLELPQELELLDLAAIIQQCHIFIGNDSGLMHLAAAVGTPTYGLFGPSMDQIYRPCGRLAYAIRTPESYHHLWQYVLKGHKQSLMGSLDPETVLTTIKRTYAQI